MSTKELESQVKVGPWTILHELGEGGMARVSFAKRANIEGDEEDQQVAVVKTPKAEFLVDARRRKLFFDEIRVASKMTHPNIVKALDWGVDEGLPYIAMEFVAGGNLSSLISAATSKEISISIDLAAYITQQVAYGLQYAHSFKIGNVSERIVHRDVAAKNVLVSGSGAVLLTDFGVASALSIESSANVLKGTAAYMAPEHAVGKATQASDCFGLGTILWSLLAGRRFRHDVTNDDMLSAAVRGHITPMARPLPADIRNVLEGLLHPEQDKRLGLVDALAVLERYPSQRSTLSNLVRQLFGSAATRSGHTRIEIETIPESLLASKEFARTQKRVDLAQPPAADFSTADVLAPAALDAPPASGAPIDATVDFGEDFNPFPRDEDAPSAPSHKRRRSSSQSISTSSDEPASAPAAPQTPPESATQLAPPQFPAAKPSVSPMGFKMLLAGLGVGTAIVAAGALGYVLSLPDGQAKPEVTVALDPPPSVSPPDPSAEPASEPLEIPEPDPEPKPEPEPETETEPRTDSDAEPESEEPETEAQEVSPQPIPVPSEPLPEPKPAAAQTRTQSTKVDVVLRLGFAESAKAKLGGRSVSLDKSHTEKTLRVPAGKRTLKWQRPDGSWGQQTWNLEEGCRHLAFFDTKTPRTSSKCPSQK